MEFIEIYDIADWHTKMREQEAVAMLRITDAQRGLIEDVDTPRFWARPYPEGDCIIFGEAWSREQAIASEVRCGADRDEAEHTQTGLDDSRKRGYLFGRCYSLIEPDGEIGSTHAVDVVPVSEDVFELARANDWMPNPKPSGQALARALVLAAAENGCPR